MSEVVFGASASRLIHTRSLETTPQNSLEPTKCYVSRTKPQREDFPYSRDALRLGIKTHPADSADSSWGPLG